MGDKMPVKKAKSIYLGQNGYARMNCAQAVMSAFKEDFCIDEAKINELQHCGGGRAPEGLCGAFYATSEILKLKNAEGIENLENTFLEHAGSVKCKEIRASKKMSCLDCIEKSATFIQEELENKKCM
jgi:hypothetical protein